MILLFLQLALITTGLVAAETTPSNEIVQFSVKVVSTLVDNEDASVECPAFSVNSPMFPTISGAFVLAFNLGFSLAPVNYIKTEPVGFDDGTFLFVLSFVPSSALNEDIIESVVLNSIAAATGLFPKTDGVDVVEINEEEKISATIAPVPTQSLDTFLPNNECRRCLATSIQRRPSFRRWYQRRSTPNFFLVASDTCIDQSSNCQDLYGFVNRCNCADENECPLALCVSPSPPSLTTTPSNQLLVLTYNVLETEPVLFLHSGQRERTCRIPQIISNQIGDTDIIVFNEVFMGGCWFDQKASIRDLLKQYGFRHSTSTVCGDSITNGGVFIASRWPIVDSRLQAFEVNLPSSEIGISRGVAYARIEKRVNKTTRYYNVFGTHLHPLDEVNSNAIRLSQAQQIRALKEEIGISVSEPVIYAGDFNSDLFNPSEEPQAIFEALNAVVPEIIGPLNATFDPVNNVLAQLDNIGDSRPEWIDYTLYGASHPVPTKATMESLALRSEKPFTICKQSNSIVLVPPFSSECLETADISDLSDHYAVRGEFLFDY